MKNILFITCALLLSISISSQNVEVSLSYVENQKINVNYQAVGGTFVGAPFNNWNNQVVTILWPDATVGGPGNTLNISVFSSNLGWTFTKQGDIYCENDVCYQKFLSQTNSIVQDIGNEPISVFTIFVDHSTVGNSTFEVSQFPPPGIISGQLAINNAILGTLGLPGPGTSAFLPIEISSFQVIKRELDGILNWVTESEQNSSHFDLLRSLDGLSWERIAQVEAQGYSTETKDYNFIDEGIGRLAQNFVYYRLKSVDRDQSYKYSDIKKINFGEDKDTHFTLYPNPTNETIHISLLDTKYKGDVELEIYDNTGKLVYQASQEIESLINYPINLRKNVLDAGMYHITLKGGDNFLLDKNFILID